MYCHYTQYKHLSTHLSWMSMQQQQLESMEVTQFPNLRKSSSNASTVSLGLRKLFQSTDDILDQLKGDTKKKEKKMSKVDAAKNFSSVWQPLRRQRPRDAS